MDILAWFVIAGFPSFVVLPGFAALFFGDSFISYKDAWILGHGLVLILATITGGIAAIIWAFMQVGVM